MPGIVFIYKKKFNDDSSKNIVNDVADQIYACQPFRSIDIDSDNKISLKLIFGSKDFYGVSKTAEGFASWSGYPRHKGKPLDGSIFSLLNEEIRKKGIKSLINDLSGCFHLVIYLQENEMSYVIADKTSSHPIYYAETDEFVCVSPEPLSFKVLKKYGWLSSLRQEAVFEYMVSGYLWGDECFLKEVKRLGPGQFACIDKGGIKIGSYWKMTFTSEKESESSLISALYEAIQKDISDLPAGKKILTLSGGYDSRALLGLFKSSDGPLNTVSYSFGSKANSGMDIDVGGYYADKAKVLHSCYRADVGNSARLISDIRNAILATSGENYLSVFQDAFLGIEFYKELANKYDYMLRGDEVWGWGDLAVNTDMAFWESRLFNLNEISHPKGIMSSEMFESGINYINGQRQIFIEECGDPKISANDLKDYLYWRHREARLLQSMAYFRRCYIPHFAPFLFDRTLEIIKRTPSRYRVQKRLFMRMGEEMIPELFLDNKAISPHSSDVNNFNFLYKEKKFRSFVKGALLESSSDVFNNIFDRKRFEPWIESVLNSNCADVFKLRKNHDFKRAAMALIGRSDYLKGCMKAFMVKKGMNTFPVLDMNYLFRLVVLSLALHEYEK